MTKYVLRFRGSVSERELNRTDLNSRRLIGLLEESIEEIRNQIETEVRREIPEIDRIKVSIDFSMGSVDWFGEVVIYLDWMARLGGAAAFVFMIKDAVRHGIDRILARRGIPDPRTVVSVTYPAGAARLMYSSEGSTERFLGALLGLAYVNTFLLLMIVVFISDIRNFRDLYWFMVPLVTAVLVFTLNLLIRYFRRW